MIRKLSNVQCLALFATLWLFLSDASTAPLKPKATVVDSVFEFGLVVEGHAIIHAFSIKNTGNAPLSILNVRTD